MSRVPQWTKAQAREFGTRLRELREERGLSQRELSFDGCTAAYISRVEKGERYPSVVLIRQMAERLRVSAEYLETGDGRPILVDTLLGRIAETTDGLSCISFGEAVEVRFAYDGEPRLAIGETLGDALLGAVSWAERIARLRESLEEQSSTLAERDLELRLLLGAETVTP